MPYMEGMHIFDSGLPGSTTLIIGMVHGNEPIGMSFLDYITSASREGRFTGKVLFLLANPRAYEQNIRFIDQDLNRSFGEYSYSNYEIKRAQELKEFFRSCGNIDYVFDIHSTPTKSDPMMICTGDTASVEITKYFPIDRTIIGLADMIEGVSFTKYLKDTFSMKNIAFECGAHTDPQTQETGKMIFESIIQIHNSGASDTVYSQEKILITDCIRTSSRDFRFNEDYQGFESISTGQIIATGGEKTVSFDREVIMVIPRPDALLELEKKDEVIVGYIGEKLLFTS